jgi:hypothetical protein
LREKCPTDNTSLLQDYDDFDLANEDDELEEFLGIPRVTPKSIPIFKKSGDQSAPSPAEGQNGPSR